MILRSVLATLTIFGAFVICAGDAPAADPITEMKALFGNTTAPKFEKLREYYLSLQEKRLLQEIPAPEARDPKNKYLSPESRSATKLSESELTELKQWFKDQPKFRDNLLLAIEPGVDDYGRAAKVALALRAKNAKATVEFENLVVAFAVVWDDPRSQGWAHVYGVPELYKKRPEPPSFEDSFNWYVTNAPRMAPWFKTTPWRLLKYLAADCMPLEERDWALKKYPAFNPGLGQEYSKIEYDKSKLSDNVGKLGSNAYTLDNLSKFGGVCRDQAFYARAVCRSYGMPAYFATGESNTEGLHAWVGWVVKDTTGYKLMSHGRYAYDKYFTAEIMNPQSGTEIFDYLVAIECKALSNEPGYNDADVYYRVWQELGEGLEAQQRGNILIDALRRSAFHRPAWLAVGEATASGILPRASAEKQWSYLQANYKEYPDFIYSMTSTFSRMFKTVPEKHTFYEASTKIFRDVKRQDLVAKLRLEQLDMCVTENRKDLAAQVAIASTTECAGEGEQGAKLAKKAAELCIEMKQPQLAIKPLQTALKSMMKIRADRINPHWVAINEALRDSFKAAGDTKGASAIESELERAKGGK